MLCLMPDPLSENTSGFQGGQLILDGVVHAEPRPFQQAVLGDNPAVLAGLQRIFATHTGTRARSGHAAQRVYPVVPHELEQRVGQRAGQLRVRADDHGRPNPDLPTTLGAVDLVGRSDGGTRMTITTTFPSREAMEQMAAMGMEEGITLAMGQMDGILASSGDG